MRRKLDVDAWPRSRTTVAFDFSGVTGKAGRWWLVVNSDDVEVCDFDPGYDLDAAVQTDLRTLTQFWRGDADWARWQPSESPSSPTRQCDANYRRGSARTDGGRAARVRRCQQLGMNSPG